MINRAALIFRARQPMIDWINHADPSDSTDPVTLDDVNRERIVYLISDEDAEVVDEWLKLNFEAVFTSELEGWYAEPSLWPSPLSLPLFREWFEVECHSMVFDTVGEVIREDGDL